jgi:hypothetical protein
LGLGIAISTEDDRDRQHLRSDFVETLEDLLTTTQLKTPLALVIIDGRHVEKIKTLEDARKVLIKTGCVFLLWGKVKNRRVKGQDNFVLDLQSAVRHGKISGEISEIFSEEMKALLPLRRNISIDDELADFELNAASVDLSARYILGVAAHLSDQVEMSIEIFEDLHKRLKRTKMQSFPVQVRESVRLLAAKVPIQLAELYFFQGSEALLRWRKHKNDDDLESMKVNADRGESHAQGTYRAALLYAIYYFVKYRDIKRARKIIAPFKKQLLPDPTWAVDEAFLLAYSGSLNSAIRYYRMAFNKFAADSRLLIETEEFILWVLSVEPEKKQLYFCLGLINYWGKRDSKKAVEDFNAFLEETNETEFPNERVLASKYVSEIGG